jgi:hypothetical protein
MLQSPRGMCLYQSHELFKLGRCLELSGTEYHRTLWRLVISARTVKKAQLREPS